MTPFRVQELESLGFEWRLSGAVWEDRLIELAAYHDIHGHCNVPKGIGENSTLGNWVAKQRRNYRLHGERSLAMTHSRIQELESLGFEWESPGGVPWEDRFIELAHYRKIHGHCNVLKRNDENSKLGKWVGTQRTNYWSLQVKGKRSPMTTFRIQELERLGFEWRPSVGRKKEAPKKSSLMISAIEESAAIKLTPLSNPNNPTGIMPRIPQWTGRQHV
jgi:hypothetical protein